MLFHFWGEKVWEARSHPAIPFPRRQQMRTPESVPVPRGLPLFRFTNYKFRNARLQSYKESHTQRCKTALSSSIPKDEAHLFLGLSQNSSRKSRVLCPTRARQFSPSCPFTASPNLHEFGGSFLALNNNNNFKNRLLRFALLGVLNWSRDGERASNVNTFGGSAWHSSELILKPVILSFNPPADRFKGENETNKTLHSNKGLTPINFSSGEICKRAFL